MVNSVARVQLALAALGAGLVHFAIAAGAGLPVALVFALCGAAELAWAGLTIARPALPFARVVPAAALVPLAVWAAALLLGSATSQNLPPLPLAIASVFDLVVAAGSAFALRRAVTPAPAEDSEVPSHSGSRFTISLVAGAFAVSALVMPALGATAAGSAAANGMHSMHDPGVELNVPDPHAGH